MSDKTIQWFTHTSTCYIYTDKHIYIYTYIQIYIYTYIHRYIDTHIYMYIIYIYMYIYMRVPMGHVITGTRQKGSELTRFDFQATEMLGFRGLGFRVEGLGFRV